jgi:YjjW family glycine radical enzyme activase
MSSLQARISNILTWSCVDGPGNRMVLFMQGCNYACAACHNPYTIGQCDHCGDCIPACEPGALSLVDGKVQFDPGICTHCDACLDACPISANPMAQLYSVEDILKLLREYQSFLSGITLSGGEATLQLPFILALFAAMRDDPELAHLTRLVDSNGHLGAAGWQMLLPLTDGVLLDIKAFDPKLHLALTGRSNDRSLASARLVHAAGKLHELRFLMVPGKTDSAAEIAHLVAFAQSLGGTVPIRLNGFRTHGVRGEATEWPMMPRADLEATADMLTRSGVGPVSLPAL